MHVDVPSSHLYCPFPAQLGIDDFGDVQVALWRARCKWYNIGVRLKMDLTDLDVIAKERGLEIEDKFNRMAQDNTTAHMESAV